MMHDVKELNKKLGRRFFWMVFGFFAVVMSVNGVFLYYALQSYSGTVTERPYEKGLAYDDALKAAQQQNEMGLSAALVYDGHSIEYQLQDEKSSNKIENAQVKLRLMRAIKEGSDFDVVLTSNGSGAYKADVQFPYKGVWIAKAEAQWEQKKYNSSHKIIVK